jgi:hypothetical protein
LLEIRPSGEVYTLDISTDATKASLRHSGRINMPDDLPIVGVKVVDESLIVFSESHLQVCLTFTLSGDNVDRRCPEHVAMRCY